jgi:hypothetical protein
MAPDLPTEAHRDDANDDLQMNTRVSLDRRFSSAMWRATAVCMAARSRSQRAVLPSMSVKRKVTVPLGRLGMIGLKGVPVQ